MKHSQSVPKHRIRPDFSRCLALTVPALALLLAACATLTEDECRGGNWFEIGFEDGTKGRLPSFLTSHAEACAKFGITPDAAPWEQGRQAGLPRYCTPQTAYDVGRNGRDLSPVCPVTDLPTLESANARGLEWNRLNERIRDLEDDIKEINAELATLEEGQEALAAALRSERQFKRLRILGLEAERRRVSTPT